MTQEVTPGNPLEHAEPTLDLLAAVFDPSVYGALDTPEFNELKRDYFRNLAYNAFNPMLFHRAENLWVRNEKGERDWGNVAAHCLVEAARDEIWAELFRFDSELTDDLKAAGAAHDFYKKGEKDTVKAGGFTLAAYDEAQAAAEAILEAGHVYFKEDGTVRREVWLTSRSIRLATSVGHSTAPTAEAMLLQSELSDEDIAYLVQHYVDDYTINDKWAEPVGLDDDGKPINDMDRRLIAAAKNPSYADYNEEGRQVFNGETTIGMQLRVGHLVEQRLALILQEYTGIEVDPPDLPRFIDNLLIQKIQGTKPA